MKENRKRKRILSLLLCMALLLSCVGIFAACGDKGDAGEDTTAAAGSSAESGTEAPPPEPVKLIENGKSEYTVVYPNEASTVVAGAVNSFVEQIYRATGVKLAQKSDYIRPNQTYDPDSKEILIGKTNRDETKQALSEIRGSDSYVIKQKGNKVVILSPNDSYVLVAVNYFVRHLLTQNLETDEASGAKTLYLEEYECIIEGEDEGNIKTKYLGGREIFDYTIVYETKRTGYQTVAEHLRDVISTATGRVLPVVPDTAAESDCEILVGKTSRAYSAECYERESASIMRYEVALSGTKLQIISGGTFSAKQCADNMLFVVFSESAEELKDGYHFDTELTTATPHTQGTDLRIMTYNLLTEAWKNLSAGVCPPIDQRAEVLASVLMQYTPDAVGLQETDAPWVTQIEFYLDVLKNDYDLEYTLLWDKYNNRQNFTPILYRSDKLTMTDSGFQPWSVSGVNPEYYIRVGAWAKFQKIGTDTEFILLNSHWPIYHGGDVVQSANEEHELMDSLIAEHNVPIFLTADYNENMNETILPNFVQESGVTVAKLKAQEAGTLLNNCSGCGDMGVQRPNAGNTIDFILVSPGCNYDVLRYEAILHNMTQFCSDHSPMVGDFRLN